MKRDSVERQVETTAAREQLTERMNHNRSWVYETGMARFNDGLVAGQNGFTRERFVAVRARGTERGKRISEYLQKRSTRPQEV